MHSRPIFNATSRLSSGVRGYRTTAVVRRDDRRILTSLNPSHLANADFLDISGHRSLRISFLDSISSKGDRIYYLHSPQGRVLFPPKTRGFFYFRSAADLSPLAGRLRFRITQSELTSSFPDGQDLLWPSGSPWEVLLAPIAMRKNYTKCLDHLLSKNLVTEEHVSLCRSIFGKHGNLNPASVIFSMKQSFIVGFSSAPPLSIVGPTELRMVHATSLFCHGRNYPYGGSARVRFDCSSLPQHAGRRVLVLRILEMIRPVQVLIPKYDGLILLPKAGELLPICRPSGTKKLNTSGPWSIDLDQRDTKVTKALRLLWTD
ncbi:hypothetical protein B0H11DRAFT_45644 [Mycena galericulata]|nr:hypothetical protein B0H11DRAFT_45644 [Mycena galericulata]